MMTSELSTGKTIFILAVVVGCFAILWPKVFYPMLTASVKASTQPAPHWRDPLNAHHLTQLCFLLEEQRDQLSGFQRWTEEDCFAQVKRSCRIDLTERLLENFRLGKDKSNLTECLRQRYDLNPQKVSAAAPPPTRTRPYQPNTVIHPHVRPERPALLHQETMHPALREKGRTMPQRTIEKEARPGPMPGLRPPMGGGGHMVPPQSKGSGAMGIIMPLYTVGIVIFFIYTIMKVLFKKNCEEDKTPKLKDFHMDPEYRKYVFAEEYLDSANASHRDLLRRQEREASRQRRRPEVTPPDTKIEDEQMDQLRRRLEETERAMERLMSQMGSVTDKLTAAKITEVLSQAQAQAKMLKELGEGASDDDMTTSDAYTNTFSDDYSLPIALQRHLLELQVKDNYKKGTSACTFVPPHFSLQEVASLAEEEAHKEVRKADESSQYPTTNGALFVTSSPIDVKLLGRELEKAPDIPEDVIEKTIIKLEKDFEQTAEPVYVEKQKETCDSKAKDLLNVKEDLNRRILEDKLKEEFSADLAQRDDNDSAVDRSSNASETGADVSELKSFADDNVYSSGNGDNLPSVQEQITPEVLYRVPEVYMPKEDEIIEETIPTDIRVPVTAASSMKFVSDAHQQTVAVMGPDIPKAIEHGTQTDCEKKFSILNFGTTYQIDKHEQQKAMEVHEVEDKINEIILDANVPMDTQLLVREAHIGSRPVENIEIDASEIGNDPCVVTSQVSLAFVGLEQNEPDGLVTIILPERRVSSATGQEKIKEVSSATDQEKINEASSATDQEKIKEVSSATDQENIKKVASDTGQEKNKDVSSATDQEKIKEVSSATGQEKIKEVSSATDQENIEVSSATGQEKIKEVSSTSDQEKIKEGSSATNQEKIKELSSATDQENIKEEWNKILEKFEDAPEQKIFSNEIPFEMPRETNEHRKQEVETVEIEEATRKGCYLPQIIPTDGIQNHAKENYKFFTETAEIVPADQLTQKKFMLAEPEFQHEIIRKTEFKEYLGKIPNIAEIHPVQNLENIEATFENQSVENDATEESKKKKIAAPATTRALGEASVHEPKEENKLTCSTEITRQDHSPPEVELTEDSCETFAVDNEYSAEADAPIEFNLELPGKIQENSNPGETKIPLQIRTDESSVDLLIEKAQPMGIQNLTSEDSLETRNDLTILQHVQLVEANLGQTIEEDFEISKELIVDVTASQSPPHFGQLDSIQEKECIDLQREETLDEQTKPAELEADSLCHRVPSLLQILQTAENKRNEVNVINYQQLTTLPISNNNIVIINEHLTAVKGSHSEKAPIEAAFSVENVDLEQELNDGTEKALSKEELYSSTSPIPASHNCELFTGKNISSEDLLEHIPSIKDVSFQDSSNDNDTCIRKFKGCPELNLIAEILVQKTTSEALKLISKMNLDEIKIIRDKASCIMNDSLLLSTSVETNEVKVIVPELNDKPNFDANLQPGKLGNRRGVEVCSKNDFSAAMSDGNRVSCRISTKKDSHLPPSERIYAVVSAEHANGLSKVEPSYETMENLVVEHLAIRKPSLRSSPKREDEGSIRAEEAVLLANKGMKNSSSSAKTAADDQTSVETKG